jgi:hypothetical protein
MVARVLRALSASRVQRHGEADAPVSETAKFWGSVVLTLVGSSVVAISIFWAERSSERRHASAVAAMERNDARAKAIAEFGASIHRLSEELYRWKLAELDWSRQEDVRDPASIKQYVGPWNAEELLKKPSLSGQLPSELDGEESGVLAFARYFVLRRSYTALPSPQALCLALATRLQTPKAREAAAALRGLVQRFENLSLKEPCNLKIVDHEREPHAVDAVCIGAMQDEISKGIDAVMLAISIELTK